MKTKAGIGRRILSLLLTFAMTTSILPIANAAETLGNNRDSSSYAASEENGDFMPEDAAVKTEPESLLSSAEDALVQVGKTAEYTGNGTSRTYDITLTARSNKIEKEIIPGEPQSIPADVALVLDTSGSMDWPVDTRNQGVYVPFNGWDNGQSLPRNNYILYTRSDASGYFRNYSSTQKTTWNNRRIDIWTGGAWKAVLPVYSSWNPIPQIGYVYNNPGEYTRSERWPTWYDRWDSWSDRTPTHLFVDYAYATRMDALKSVVYDFIYQLNPESKVAIDTFSSDAKDQISLTPLEKEKDQQKVLDQITGLKEGDGGTYIYKGLKNAISKLKGSKNSNKVIVAFTDGADYDRKNAEAQAKAARNADIRIFTISLIDKNVPDRYKSGSTKSVGYDARNADQYLKEIENFLRGISSDADKKSGDDTQYYYSCTDLDGLVEAMTQISESASTVVESSVPIENATITDVLDPRFQLSSAEKTRLKKDGATVEEKEDGTTKIIWKNQEIPGKKTWSRTISIQAKGDFLGGNDITTNLYPNSNVSYEEDGKTLAKSFPQPTVHVPLKFSVKSQDTKIFLGETVPVKLQGTSVEEQMFNEAQWNWYGKEKTGTFHYEWQNKNDDYIAELGKISPLEDSAYTLNVTFHPFEPMLESSGPEQASKTEKNDYTVQVVRGSIRITKELNASDVWFPNGDPIFTFKLERLEGGTVKETNYRTVRFTRADEQDGVLTLTADFEDLKKGEYRITEVSSLLHHVKTVSVSSGDKADSQVKGKSVQSYLGYHSASDSATNVSHNYAEVHFLNTEKEKDFPYFTHTDLKSNAIQITFSGENDVLNPDGTPTVPETRQSAEKPDEKRTVRSASVPKPEMIEDFDEPEEIEDESVPPFSLKLPVTEGPIIEQDINKDPKEENPVQNNTEQPSCSDTEPNGEPKDAPDTIEEKDAKPSGADSGSVSCDTAIPDSEPKEEPPREPEKTDEEILSQTPEDRKQDSQAKPENSEKEPTARDSHDANQE
ncbi:vWA domain-containing protein [Clostridium minihomine]|uniref:vWA domain-containing protein n=1 Tax=Clostridium minihomine TaxID=2045012 RepID=UPI000C764F5A|nr:vWA domain-containing protein [Clostridium minihomine]